MKVVVIKPGQCAVCSKPVGKENTVTYHGACVHVGCLTRIVKGDTNATGIR